LVLPVIAYTLSSTKLETRAEWFLPGSEGYGSGQGEGGKMTQTLYAHINKIKKIFKSILYLNSPPPSIPGIVYIHIFCTIFTLLATFLAIPTPIGAIISTSPCRICSTLLFSDFVEEKRKTCHFFLFEIKVVTQGVSL
jgi:hypothetical protein